MEAKPCQMQFSSPGGIQNLRFSAGGQPVMKIAFSLFFACLLSTAPLVALGAASPGQAASQTPQSSAVAASDPSLNDLLSRVKATAEKTDEDLGRLRIDKWKADGDNKRQAQSSADSIHRNLVNAVPDLIQAVQAAPGSLLANFRLYRDLNALYETFYALTESAGAFGSSGEYQALAADLEQLDSARQQFAQRLDLLAGANDAELARLRSRPAAAPAKGPPTSNKIVVDENQPVKKKRKPAASQP